jgi:AAA family ATPase
MECWLPLLLQLTWDDVGGLSAVKQRLQEAVLWPQQHADALARLGATAPKGVLLYGPPGCSKTLLARAVAATAGLNFLSVKGGELYSKYVGESERAVAALFARARGAAPAIVFLDEIDALVSARGDGGGAGIGERVLAQLLTELDGLQVRSKGFMFWPRVPRVLCSGPACCPVFNPHPEKRVETCNCKL